MVVATIRVAIEDAYTADKHGLAPEENVKTGEEPFFLDGPVAERVAVVDRDPTNGQLTPAARWLERERTYDVPADLKSPQAMATSVFGIVMETLEMFERPDVLGHKVRWAFDSPQLLLVPRAGAWNNAFYDRNSRSLQLFFFDAQGRRIYTALSRDIVAHETGHAVLDGLAPALLDALTPQSLALHEAIGDLTAIVMALQSEHLREWLVRNNHGTLSGDTPVSRLADEFGWATTQGHRPLRDANNDDRLDPNEREPHVLCRPLVGAVWKAMARLEESAQEAAAEDAAKARETSKEAVQARTLGISARRIARVLFRALDYLPPAEATFADYAKALLRADTVAYERDDTGYRETLTRQFVERGIVGDANDLDHTPPEPVRVELNDLVESEWMAYEFANRNRELLGIGNGLPARQRNRIPFRLFPRRRVKRRYYLGPGEHEERPEVVFQVTWEEREPNTGISGLPAQRAVFRGTTLVLGGQADERGRYPVYSCLSSDGAVVHIEARNEMLASVVESGQLAISDSWEAVGKRRPYAPVVLGRTGQGILRVRGTGRLLHLAGGEQDDG